MTALQKYEEPSASGTEPILHVLFQVAGTDYVLPSDTVLQMESFTGATPVPGAPAFVVGIVQVRGRVVPVVDLRCRFGHEASPIGLDSRLVIGQRGDRIVGLLVDRAREVVKLSPAQLKPPPPILDLDARGFVKAVAQLGPRLVMLVDFAKVIGRGVSRCRRIMGKGASLGHARPMHANPRRFVRCGRLRHGSKPFMIR